MWLKPTNHRMIIPFPDDMIVVPNLLILVDHKWVLVATSKGVMEVGEPEEIALNTSLFCYAKGHGFVKHE